MKTYPNPIASRDLIALMTAWSAHFDAEKARQEHWQSLPDDFGRYETFKDDPQVLANDVAQASARARAETVTKEIESRYPWLGEIERYVGMSIDPARLLHLVESAWREAVDDAFREEHKEELAPVRMIFSKGPSSTSPPVSGYFLRFSPEGAFRISKATHEGRRVFGIDENGTETRLMPGHSGGNLDRGTGYTSISQELTERLWSLRRVIMQKRTFQTIP